MRFYIRLRPVVCSPLGPPDLEHHWVIIVIVVYLTVEMGDVSIGPLVPSASSMVLLVLLEGQFASYITILRNAV